MDLYLYPRLFSRFSEDFSEKRLFFVLGKV